MGAVRDFLRRYGGVVTAYAFLGCGFWLLGMIVLPQLLMVEKSLLYSDRSVVADISRANAEIDRLFVARQRLERRIDSLGREPAGAGGAAAAAAGGTSLFNPFGAREPAGSEKGAPERIDEARSRLERIDRDIAELERFVADARQRAEPRYSLENYLELFSNDANRPIFFKTIWASILVTLVALVICYPVAFYLAKSAPANTTALLMLGLVVPYWVNEILRVFSWLMILADHGVLNQFLIAVGLADGPIDWRDGNKAVIIGMTYAYILFMVFPIYNTIETLDPNQIEAARDLGAPWWLVHWAVVIPHAKPGIAVGCIMTFMLAAGSYAVPVMLGSTTSKWFTEIIYDQFYEASDWGLGSAYAFVLLLVCLVFISLMMRLFRVGLQDIAK